MNIGDKVIVKTHRHPDVIPGAEGVIDSFHRGGVGVAVKGQWAVAGGDRGQTKESVEVCWYPPFEIEVKS